MIGVPVGNFVKNDSKEITRSCFMGVARIHEVPIHIFIDKIDEEE